MRNLDRGLRLAIFVTALFLVNIGNKAQDAVADNHAQGESSVDSILPPGKPHGAYDPHSRLTPQKHIEVAIKHINEGRTHEAIDALGRAIMQNPENARLYAVRGSIYLQQKQVSAALKDFNASLELDPKASDVLTNRAQAFLQFGEIEKALGDLDAAIAANPDSVAAYFNRGVIHFSSDAFQKALADFDQCIAIDPHAAGPYFNRASTKHALGDMQGATEDINRFIELSDNKQWIETANKLLGQWQTNAN